MRPWIWSALACAALAALLAVMHVHIEDVDFQAFYCGSTVALHGGDPYLQQPLQSCEDTVYLHRSDSLVLPDPRPPYAMLLTAPVAIVPYEIARWLWLALTLGALVGIAFSLSKLSGLPVGICLVATLLLGGIESLNTGQTIPFSILGICLAALAMRRGRPWMFVLGLCLALLQPLVGVPCAMAAFVSVGKFRFPVLAAIAGLFTASLAFAGPHTTFEYLRVVPAHALTELSHQRQLALGPLLFQLGVPLDIALRTAWFVSILMLVAGIAVGRRAAHRWNDAAFVMVTPAAFILIGGTFIHLPLFAAALPCVFTLLRYWERSTATAFAVIAFCIPWLYVTLESDVLVLTALGVGYLAIVLPSQRNMFAGAVFTIAVVAIVAWSNHACVATLEHHAGLDAYADPRALAQISWAMAERSFGHVCSTPVMLVVRLLTVGTIVVLLGRLCVDVLGEKGAERPTELRSQRLQS